MADAIKIKFEGGYAENHVMPLRSLAASMAAADKLLANGLVLALRRRAIKRNERLDIIAIAKEPHEGSFEIQIAWDAVGLLIPAINEALVSHAGELCWQWLSALLLRQAGRKSEAQEMQEKLLDTMRDMHAEDLRTTREIHERDIENQKHEREATRQLVESVMDKMQADARSFVSPVGGGCDEVTLQGWNSRDGCPTTEKTRIDKPMAEAVRSTDELEVGDLEAIEICVDGVIKHNKTLKIELCEEPGKYYSADVVDPAFQPDDNVYLEALGSGKRLRVIGKRTLKNGKLHKLTIMHAGQSDETEPQLNFGHDGLQP